MRENFHIFLDFEIFHFKNHSINVFELLSVVSIFIITKIVLWGIKKGFNKKTKYNKLDKGSSFALFQLIKYIIWIGAIVFMLESVNVKVTYLLAGSAALLVGVGLGLQQTFNDILSGIILLFEKSVKVGDR